MLFDQISNLSETVKNISNLKIIRSSIISGSLSHAYLFAGNDMDFLTEIALFFAASVNCEKNGCGNCRICSNTLKGIFENLLILEPEGNIFTIDKVAELQKFASFSAHSEGMKLCIIKEADLMNREAANRILKVLEEPPDDKSIFILLTEDLSGIIPTISSRCIIFEWDFKVNENIRSGFDRETLEKILDRGLQSITGPKDIRAKDNYSLSIDLSLQINDFFKQQLSYGNGDDKKLVLDFKNIGATASEIKKFETSLNLKNKRTFSKYYNIGINMVFDIITAWLEDILSVSLGAEKSTLNYPQKYDFISENFTKADSEKVLKLIATVEKNRNYLKYSTNQELALDNIFLQMQALIS